jgi:selenide,water dikinase
MFDASHYPKLLVGLGVADDAAVYQIDTDTAIVATLDFFAPLVDDPRDFGGVAAANAMSDIYAMGGEVILGLNIAAFPEDLPASIAAEIVAGAAEKMIEGGGVIAGGHTIWDSELKFGLSVLGIAHPARLFRKSGLQPGDALYLTKPLGTGTILSAAKQGLAQERWVEAATTSMLRLNRHASHLAREAGVTAATDITGFGLLGHLWEMAERSSVRLTIESGRVPLLEGGRECSAMGAHTGGEGRNREWVGDHVTFEADVAADLAALLFDPQTSGGLLLAVPSERAPDLDAAFRRDGEPAWPIGTVAAGAPRLDVV